MQTPSAGSNLFRLTINILSQTNLHDILIRTGMAAAPNSWLRQATALSEQSNDENS
ncbi:hypothetical protein [Photobacterium swingsii]|uniref:hypothetical protein n=1 Tax=Photobacterium swingsii TaxID=680026 RepID=UPI004068C35E